MLANLRRKEVYLSTAELVQTCPPLTEAVEQSEECEWKTTIQEPKWKLREQQPKYFKGIWK